MKRIIADNENNESRMIFILSQISEHINSLKKIDKKESIKLLSSITYSLKDVSPYLSRVLTIIQSNINDENVSIFTIISNTFGDIVEKSLIKYEKSSKTKKTVYELLQGFCIYNMKQENKANQICGSLCLTSLIETCSMILLPAYMKYIWDNVIYFIDKPNFHAKSELLNSLISLIFASENIFKPFSTVTLYKILDFLTDNDWFKRKLALNVIYTLIIYCQDEILPLKGHIVEFLRVLKSDKVEEVREVCMQTLKLFNESFEEVDYETEKKSKENLNENNKLKNKGSNLDSNRVSKESLDNLPNKYNKKIDDNSNTSNKNNKKLDDKENPNLLNKNKQIKCNKEKKQVANSEKNNELNNYLPVENINNKNKNIKSKIPHTSKVTNKNILDELNISSIKAEPYQTGKISKPQSLIALNENKSPITPSRKSKNTKEIMKTVDLSADDNNVLNLSRGRDVNRKDDNTFVNAKMVIKRDPSYSIFKTNANKDFFSNAPKEQGEIQIKIKEKGINENEILDSDVKISLENNYIKNEDNNLNDIDFKNSRNILEMSNNEIKYETFSKENNKNSMQQADDEIFFNEKIPKIENKSIANAKANFNDQANAIAVDHKGNKNIYNNYFEGSFQKKNTDNIYREITPTIIDAKKNDNREKNKIELSDVLKQMKLLSDKQIFLIDSIEKIQERTQEQFENMNNRINKLENTIQQLMNIIKSSEQTNGSKNISNGLGMRNNSGITTGLNNYSYGNNISNQNLQNDNHNLNILNNHNNQIQNEFTVTQTRRSGNSWSDILQELKNKNATAAFKIALESEEANLIKLIDKINLNQLKEVDIIIIEEVISISINLLKKGQFIMIIITFLKNLLVNLDFEVKNTTSQNIKDILYYISSNKIQFNLSNEEMIDINILLSYINSRVNKIGGISNLIDSFAGNS